MTGSIIDADKLNNLRFIHKSELLIKVEELNIALINLDEELLKNLNSVTSSTGLYNTLNIMEKVDYKRVSDLHSVLISLRMMKKD